MLERDGGGVGKWAAGVYDCVSDLEDQQATFLQQGGQQFNVTYTPGTHLVWNLMAFTLVIFGFCTSTQRGSPSGWPGTTGYKGL